MTRRDRRRAHVPAILGVRATAASSYLTTSSHPGRPRPISLPLPAFFLLEQSSSELAPLATAGRNPPPPLEPLSIPRALSSLTTPSTFPDPHLSSSPAELAETLTLPSAAIGANPSSAFLALIRFSDHPPLKSTPRTGLW